MYQVSQIARIARISSRMRAAGALHGMLKRLVMCGRICEPSPRMKRPRETALRSWAVCASVIGLRANATAIEVISSSRELSTAASTSGRNGSLAISAVTTPS